MTECYAWTPGAGSYKHYPQYFNVKALADGGLCVTVRGAERWAHDDPTLLLMGPTISINLPADVAAEFRAFFASVDTHPKDGDVKQAPLVSGAVPEGQTPNDCGDSSHD